MHKRPFQPTRRWKKKSDQENCPNRAVLDPNHLPHPMKYHPLGRKRKKKEGNDDADPQTVPPQPEEETTD